VTVHFNKKRNRWTYDFQADGVRHQGYCLDSLGQPVTSKSAAKQAEGVARRLASMAPKLASAAETTLAQVIADLQPSWMRERQWPNKRRTATEIIQFFGADMAISALDENQVRRYVEFVMSQTIKVWTGAQRRSRTGEGADAFWKDTGKARSPATVNRRLAVLRMILNRASEMRDPLTGARILERIPKIEDLPEPKRRARPTPEPVLARLQEILPPHAIDALVLTLCFGFRKGEAFGLQESQVDWHAEGVRLFNEHVKDAEDVFLPGSQFAMGYLRCLSMEADARRLRHLISYRREPKAGTEDARPWRPIKNPKTAWRTAMNKIEAEFGRRWRWHDLRAAFITHIAITCGPLPAQKLARHSDFDTTRAYIEVADEMTRMAADRAGERPALRLVGKGKSP
jgi:integrase